MLATGTSGQAAASSVESVGTHECEAWPKALHSSVKARSVNLIGAIGLKPVSMAASSPGYIDVEARRGGETCDLDLLETAPCDAGHCAGSRLPQIRTAMDSQDYWRTVLLGPRTI